jgi:hypothetical protein
MAGESVLTSSVCVSTMLNNVPVVVTGVPYGKCRLSALELYALPPPADKQRRDRHSWHGNNRILHFQSDPSAITLTLISSSSFLSLARKACEDI